MSFSATQSMKLSFQSLHIEVSGFWPSWSTHPDFVTPKTSQPYSLPSERTAASQRSEEHTSELQSRFDLVCRLLLEKKKTHSKREGPSDRIAPVGSSDRFIW